MYFDLKAELDYLLYQFTKLFEFISGIIIEDQGKTKD